MDSGRFYCHYEGRGPLPKDSSQPPVAKGPEKHDVSSRKRLGKLSSTRFSDHSPRFTKKKRII